MTNIIITTLEELKKNIFVINITPKKIRIGFLDRGDHYSVSDALGILGNERLVRETFDGRCKKQVQREYKLNAEIFKYFSNESILHGVIYQPYRLTSLGEKRIITVEGKRYWNEFTPPKHQDTDKRDLIQPFLKLVKHLTDDDSDWFINWLAHLIQKPDENYHISPLFINKNDDAGHVILVENFIHPLIGERNLGCLNLDGNVRSTHTEKLLTRFNTHDSFANKTEMLRGLILGGDLPRLQGGKPSTSFHRYILFDSKERDFFKGSKKYIKSIINNNEPLNSYFYDELCTISGKPECIGQIYSYLTGVNTSSCY